MQLEKKIKKGGSYLSMDNLDINEEDNDSYDNKIESKKGSKIDIPDLKLDNESVILHPHYILEQAFSKVTAVGSSTVVIGIRN